MIPFELHALEALLMTVNSIQQQEFAFLSNEVNDILSYFKVGTILQVDEQERMRRIKNSTTNLTSRIQAKKRALIDVLEDDDVMALMNLTQLRNQPVLYR